MNTLYHYCSSDTFHAMLSGQALWLSSLTSSNDYMEGKLVSQAVARIARSEGLSTEETMMMQDSIALMEAMFDGLGFCLSEDGDLLSQWRGYASDGMGVSIGFNKEFLQHVANTNSSDEGISVQLSKVEYDPAAHEELVRPTFDKMRTLLSSPEWTQRPPNIQGGVTTQTLALARNAALRTRMQIMLAPLKLLYQVFLMKAPAFSEEREWRLVNHLTSLIGSPPLYRATDSRLIPFRSYGFHDYHLQPISEVILGPKHRTPTLAIQQCLAHFGFGEVSVFQSRSSYR